MLGVFTDPYPGELLYSVIARLQERLRTPNVRELMRRLFGHRAPYPSIPFPCGVGRLVDALPTGHTYSADYILKAHTLFPFYAFFLPVEMADQLRKAMIESNRQSLWRIVAKLHGLVSLPDSLRYCVKCMEDDRQLYGEPYWHRLHQIPGVMICDRHSEYLGQISLPIRHGRFTEELVTAGSQSGFGVPAPIDWRDPTYRLLLEIAQDARWIIEQSSAPPGLSAFRERYVQVLIERGLARPTGSVKRKEVLARFKDFCPPHALKVLRQFGGTNDHMQWVTALTGTRIRVLHPHLHLLFCHFLGHTIQSLVSLAVDEHSIPKTKRRSAVSSLSTGKKPFGHRRNRSNIVRDEWVSRDRELSSQIQSTINTIRSYGSLPVRVTPREVWRHIEKPGALKRNPNRFPLSLKVLEDSRESSEDFWIRRIRWAAGEYRDERHCPSRSDLLKRAGVRSISPRVSHVITEMLADLEGFPMLGRPVQRLLFDLTA